MHNKIIKLDYFLLNNSFKKEAFILKEAIINSFTTENLSDMQNYIMYFSLAHIKFIFDSFQEKIYKKEDQFEDSYIQKKYDKYIAPLVKDSGYTKVSYTLSWIERFLNIKINKLANNNPDMGFAYHMGSEEGELEFIYDLKDFHKDFSSLFPNKNLDNIINLRISFTKEPRKIIDIEYDEEEKITKMICSLNTIADYFFKRLKIDDFSLFVSNFKFFNVKINNFILQKGIRIIQNIAKNRLGINHGFEEGISYTGDYRQLPILEKEIKFLGKKHPFKRPDNFYPMKTNLLSNILISIIREFFRKGIYIDSFFNFENFLDSKYDDINKIKDKEINKSKFYNKLNSKRKELVVQSINNFFDNIFKENRVLWYQYTDDTTYNSLWVDVLRNHFIDLIYNANSVKLPLVDSWAAIHLPFLKEDIDGNKDFVKNILSAFDYRMKREEYIDGRGVADSLYELSRIFGVEDFGHSYFHTSPHSYERLHQDHKDYFFANHYKNLTRNEDDSSTELDSFTEESNGKPS